MSDTQYEIVKKILAKYPYTFYAYGSRARGDAHQFSDLDICVKEHIPLLVREAIKEEFSQSDLLYTVDIVDLTTVSSEFKKNVIKDLLLIA